MAWREVEFTPGAPEGRFPLKIAFVLAGENDSDRALAVGVTGGTDEHFLQLLVDVTVGDASSFRFQFDVEAWDARDGVFVAPLNRFFNTPDDPGEAAFHVTVDMDTGNGFATLVDLGTATTGPTLQPMVEGIVDGNADANRVLFDSGIVAAAIPRVPACVFVERRLRRRKQPAGCSA